MKTEQREPNHTPDPWKAVGHHKAWFIEGPSERVLESEVLTFTNTALVASVNDQLPPEEAEANAHLLASAPRLKKSLEQLLLSTELNLDEMEPETTQAIEEANEALAQAKGGA